VHWLLVGIAGWLLTSIACALLIGQGIRLSDRRERPVSPTGARTISAERRDSTD
jgi:hypothetical protein